MIYQYLDGNGNKYVVKRGIPHNIEYIPIKPLMSSSGLYNGGNLVKKELSEMHYNEIISLINEALKNKRNHIEKRVKMSGMIIINEEHNETTCILAPHSPEINQIEKLLQEILNI